MVSFTKSHQQDFDQLMKTKSSWMSFNHFLSTGKILKMFFYFARQTILGILFAMTIDSSILFTIFANIEQKKILAFRYIPSCTSTISAMTLILILTSDNDRNFRI